MGHLVFAYGTLLLSGVQESVMGRQIAGKPDRLAGYRKSSVRDGDTSYPNIVSAEGEYVDGFILEVSEEELARMDMYEGGHYTRGESDAPERNGDVGVSRVTTRTAGR